MRTKFTLLSTK